MRGLFGSRRSVCPLPSCTERSGHAYRTVEKRFRIDPRRNSQRYPYAFTSHPVFSLTLMTIPHALRYRAHAHSAFAQGRDALPTVPTRYLPLPIFPDSPLLFTNGHNVGHVTLGLDTAYLLPSSSHLPSRIACLSDSHHVAHALICTSVFFRIPHHDILSHTSGPRRSTWGLKLGLLGSVLHSSPSSSSSPPPVTIASHALHCRCIT
ncbi:hypothetical protein BD311DRAFT_5886 [Dichomitus squalens]|uniref:Uncharacterized protein n=1 Tax=Dichomitus squalens TaxID=114155 RepID=A0A4Q9N4J1_9APHY|nr:hypothetical protein BD311DRAFT_5886 [Dichomitus squalens]